MVRAGQAFDNAAFDILIRGGTLVDDRGAVAGDLGIRGDRIAVTGDLSGGRAAREIDAAGRVVAPGFIDPHIHSEIALLAQDPEADAGLRQGVTTNFTGPDGFGFAQLPPALARETDASL